MKTRVLSAIVLLAIIIPILIIGKLPFKIFVILISILGLYELMNLRKKKKELPLIMRIFSYILLGLFIFFCNDNYSINFVIDYRLLIGLLLIYLLPVVLINDSDKYNINAALFLIGGVLFLTIGFNTFVVIRNIDLSHIIYLALITVMTDTFALFTGMLIGKHKLCEKISPNKTIEGAVGGSIVGTIIPVLFYIYVINGDINIFLIIGITLFLTIIGQIGDLLFSSIKRYYKVKDFSNLIPGHGGILDRFDSLLLVVITYLLFIGIL